MTSAIWEASELGWKPGNWPVSAVIDGKMCWRGQSIYHAGEFAGYVYGTIDGKFFVEVLND